MTKKQAAIDWRTYGPAVLPLATATGAAVSWTLYVIVFYGYILINKESINLIQSNVSAIVGIVLTSVSFVLLIIYATGIGKPHLLAAAMLTNAVRIAVSFVSGIVSYRENQIKFVPNIYNYISIAILFVFTFAGINLLVNPAKIRTAALSSIIVLMLNAVMLIIFTYQNVEACREYMAALEYFNLDISYLKSLLNSAASGSYYYLSQILMCLTIIMISRKIKPISSVPKAQPTSSPASE